MKNQLPTYSRIIKKRPPPILFHYTTPMGLIGIARSKNIWATDIKFLNDKKEIQHALDLTHSIIDDFFKVNSRPNKLKGLSYDFVEYLRIKLSKNWNPEVYVASFTEEGDLLSQWRGYCPKGGFSLGFSSNMLSVLADKHDSFLLPCVYNLKTKNKLIEELFVSYSNKFDNAVKNDNNPDGLANNISNEFIISLFAISPMLKHDSFKEEKEWRIVSSNLRTAPDVKFRANESSIIPYIEMGVCDSESEIEFKKIFIGPASANHFTKEAVLQLLKKNRIPQSAIKFSSAPYRCA